MHILSFVLTSLCLMLTVAPTMAKDQKGQKPMDSQAMMELWKQATTPGEPHKLFATLAGSWTTATKTKGVD